ncbi:MAG: tandem-95 repeat protein [Bacteroidetes bacterium]|nr:tandem-95 repeat protein [Bacteroidota bacterium]
MKKGKQKLLIAFCALCSLLPIGKVAGSEPASTISGEWIHRLKLGINKLVEEECPGTTFFNFQPPAPPPTTVSVRVAAGSDDAEQNLSSGAVSLTSNDLELIYDGVNQIVGLRFNGIGVPQGATITNAYLEFQADEAHSGATSLTFRGQAADNASTFTTAVSNISSRAKTTASVSWSSMPAWAIGTKYQSPSIKTVVQEIVSRVGWASGNSMVMLVEGSGTRTAECFEELPAAAPLLVIEFATAVETCNNGNDDDGDGLIDANDPDCGADIMETIPAGSYIINMGVQPQTAANAIKPYGLVWHLLHEHEIPVIWSINPDKLKDGVDFTYNGVDYKGGPFIVSAEYRTPAVNALILAWQAQGVVGVTTTSDITVPVNRVLSYSMNWTLNTNNGQIAQAYLDRAGIPSTAYNWTLPQNLDCCSDVFLMPHSEPTWATHNRLLTWNASTAQGGCAGALWAGCKAGSEVENIVNPANPAQRLNFLMLPPVAPATSPAVWSGDHSDGTLPYSYGYPAHPVMQFLGTLDGAQENGAEQIYLPTNSWRPTTFVGIWDPDHPNVPSISPGKASKLSFGPAFGDAAKGYVMYQTGHRQDKDDLPANIAAQRAFFNFSMMAAGQKAIHVNSNIPELMVSLDDYTLTASATGGTGNYYFHWTSSCPGTFSNPYAATTTFTAGNVLTDTDCSIKATVTDDCGTRVGFANVQVIIVPKPAPPVAVDDYEGTQPGSPVTVNALSNDSDPNLDPLTLTALIGSTNTGNGVFVNNGNGSVTYTPNFNFTGIDQINYQVCDNTPPADGGPLCDIATIFITVDWTDAHGCYPNQYYGIAAQGYATVVTAQNSISNASQALGAPVLVASSNAYYAKIDADADYLVLDLGYNLPVGDTVFLHIGSDDGASATLKVTGTLNSSNNSNGNGFYDLRSYTTVKDLNDAAPQEDVVAYVPVTGAARKLRFTRAAGAGKPSVNGVRYVDKNCLSAVPVANNDAVTLCEDNVVNINVLANDTDPQGLPLIVSIVTPPSQGVATVQSDGTVRYKPNADYSGTDNFIYQACNSNGLCDPATVSITVYDDSCPPGYYKVSVGGVCSGSCVLSPNNPPDAINDFATTVVNTPVSITVQSNDIDPSGLGMTTYLGFSNPPDNGTVVLDGEEIRYTPTTGFVGQDNFNYKICNPYGCDSALVTVDVLCADPAGGKAIQGMVFNDANNNASLTNGEMGIGNVRVRLYSDLNSNGVVNAGETKIDSALTDSQGNYVFNVGDGTVSSSSSTTNYAINGSGLISEGSFSAVTGAPDNGFVKLKGGDYVTLEFANIIPLGTVVSIYLASDSDDGEATVSGSLDGVSFGNPANWIPTYASSPGNPPPASAVQVFSYQVAAPAGVKFVKILRVDHNIYVDAASWQQTTSSGSSTTASLSSAIGTSSDDAEEEGPEGVNLGPGGMYLTSSDLEITQDLQSPSSGTQKIGLRFNTINIPAGVVITSATLSFKAIAADSPNTNSGATSLTIKGQAADNATTFTTATNNISNRTLTTASTAWNPVAWTSGTTYTSPELKSIVQEIVNRPGWANGNSMAFVITGTGSRSSYSYDGSSSGAPVLDITYATSGEATINLSAQKDNQVTQGSTNNHGASQSLDSYNSGGIVRRPLFKFDLASIPSNAVITSASMELYTYFIATANTPVKAHRLTADWTEGTANAAAGVSNWTQRLASPSTNWTTAGGDYDATPAASVTTNGTTAGTYSFNVASLVQSWVNGNNPNHGVILLNDPGYSGVSWRSREWATASQQPKLVVQYSIGGSNGYYVLTVNPASFPPNSTLTTDNLETAVVLNNGDVDCANNFGLINNRPPIANPDTAYVDAGTTALINVIVNDSDPENTPLNMTILTNPPSGTAVNNGNGTLNFTPSNGFTGWQTFLYKICDSGTPTLCDTSTVTVFVSVLINDPPVAQDDYDTTVVNFHVETDVLDNDFDQEFGNLTAKLSPGIQQPANGTVAVVNNKLIEYAPNAGYTGNDVYQYIVCDDRIPSLCDTARVFIHVKNRPPDARPDFVETQMNLPVPVPVIVNDIEPDGHAIILMSAGTNATPTNGLTAKGGTVSVNTNGTPANFADDFINYSPPAGYFGLDTTLYKVRDSGTPNGYDITYVEVRVSGLIDLELTKTVNPAVSSIGQDVTFTLTLTNKGPVPATNVLTMDKLTSSYQYLSDNGAGMYDPVSGVWYVPSMAVNQTRTLTITAKILNNALLKNVTQVIAADQVDVDSRPNNDDGDQSEDDEDSATPTLEEICNNGTDGDGDGLVDCADPDCSLNLLANAGPDASICTGASTTLTASGGDSYFWSTGETTSSINVTPASTTNYSVTVSNAMGCSDEDQLTVTVTYCPEICNNGFDDDYDGLTDCADTDCAPGVNAGSNVNICTATSTVLTAAAAGGVEPYTFVWDNGLGAGASHSVSPASTTTYHVTVTSASGCTAVDSVTVTVVFCPENCTDGTDNDFDGLVDCADPDCQMIGQPQLADDVYETCPGAVFTEQPIFNDDNLQFPQYSISQNPSKGSVSINYQGVFVYTPSNSTCGVDSFRYQVCNAATGCCDQAKVTLLIGDNEPPVFYNLPADLTINCGEPLPGVPAVYAVDGCPGIYLSYEETDTWQNTGACQNYTITRTWVATDICGNSATGTQTITVLDLSGPDIFRVYTLSNGKKLMAGFVQNATTAWQNVKFPINFDVAPLVFSQVVSSNDDAPIVVRQRNINAEGFEMRIREEEAADGIHAPELVAWMALEPGVLNDGSNLQAATLTEVTNVFKTLTFTRPFTVNPVFIASVQTFNEADPFEIRTESPTASSIRVQLEEEQSFDFEKNHVNETMAWLAVKTGPIVDKNADFVGVAGTVAIGTTWQTVILSRQFMKPVVLFGGQPSGNDPATIRVRNVTGNSFEVKIQEWAYLNGNLPDRTVSYLVVEGSVPAYVEDPCVTNPPDLLPEVDMFAVDNCDNQLAFNYSKASQMSPQGELITHIWSALDDCGNETKVTRVDTCRLAAVRLKTNLYGAVIGNNNGPLMRDNLRTKGFIPLLEPYSNMTGFHHKGAGGGEETTPEMLAVTGADAIVDWVFVEIRDEQQPAIVLATSAALLQRDGDIVTAEGAPAIYLEGLQEGEYYVSIRHRNHLGLMFGASGYLTIADPPLLDFKLVNEAVNGGPTAGNMLNNTRSMWLGDINGDRRVIYQGPNNDVFSLFSEVMSDDNNVGNLANFIKQGYLNTDLNMDGNAIYQGPNNDRALLLYHTILVNPDNPSNLANFIASEKLP